VAGLYGLAFVLAGRWRLLADSQLATEPLAAPAAVSSGPAPA
jgi:hypothetical protein